MTAPKDLIPQRYEVLKLRTGSEIVGMVRDTHEGLEITLPMICQLEVIPYKSATLATFYPYSPLSSDPTVVIPKDLIAHRNTMNTQFVEYYDEASAKWFDMVENKKIPLVTNPRTAHRDYIRRVVDELMNATGGPITEREEKMLKRIEEEEWNIDDEIFADFESSVVPTDKKKIH